MCGPGQINSMHIIFTGTQEMPCTLLTSACSSLATLYDVEAVGHFLKNMQLS